MTKELELLVKKWRDDGIRLNGGADKPYSDDENSVRAFVLEHCAEELAAALAKAQEGLSLADAEKVLRESSGHAWEFMGDSIVVSLDTAIATLTAQQKAPEGEEECETCEGRGWHDERLGGYSFSNPKAPCPDCDGTGQLSDSAAPGGDVRLLELAARWERLADSFYEQGSAISKAEAASMRNDARELREAIAALSAPKQVGVEDTARLDFMLDQHANVETNGTGEWRVAYEYTSPPTYGPYANSPRAAIDAEMGNSPQAAQVPVEGDAALWVHPGEMEATRRVKESFNGDGLLTASELEQFRGAVEASYAYDKAMVEQFGCAPLGKDVATFMKDSLEKRVRLLAIIDAAKAGRVDHG